MESTRSLQTLLDTARLTHPCDLDLLLFFHRHPSALMASEHLALFAGYDLAQVARSLDLLVGAGVLRRSLNPTHIGRLYDFTADGGAGWLPPLLATASTPDGRRRLIRLLQDRSKGTGRNPAREIGETPEEANNHA